MSRRSRTPPKPPRRHVLDTQPELLHGSNPKAIALALKQAADASEHRKAGPFNSAMSVLSLHINRAGATLDPAQRRVLEAAKDELRTLYGRPARR